MTKVELRFNAWKEQIERRGVDQGWIKFDVDKDLGDIQDLAASTEFGFHGTDRMWLRAVNSIARRNTVDPARDLLDELQAKWDRVPRLEEELGGKDGGDGYVLTADIQNFVDEIDKRGVWPSSWRRVMTRAKFTSHEARLIEGQPKARFSIRGEYTKDTPLPTRLTLSKRRAQPWPFCQPAGNVSEQPTPSQQPAGPSQQPAGTEQPAAPSLPSAASDETLN